MRQKWSKEKIVATIKDIHSCNQPLNYCHVHRENPRLMKAAIRYFGGWAQAIAAAGLDYSQLQLDYSQLRKELPRRPPRSWSKTAIVAEIIRRASQGMSIRHRDVFLEDRRLCSAAMLHFGKRGWAQARVLAGFEPTDPIPWKIWNEQTVCEEILRLHKNGIALNTEALKESAYAHVHSAGREVFGSWKKAIKAAGLDYSKIRKGRQRGWWTKARILMCIKKLEKRGVRLSMGTVRLSAGALVAQAVVRFGSWSQAVEAAGISYRHHCRTWSSKAWLSKMQQDEYEKILESAETLAKKRRKK